MGFLLKSGLSFHLEEHTMSKVAKFQVRDLVLERPNDLHAICFPRTAVLATSAGPRGTILPNNRVIRCVIDHPNRLGAAFLLAVNTAEQARIIARNHSILSRAG
jgi:hypothetical protein